MKPFKIEPLRGQFSLVGAALPVNGSPRQYTPVQVPECCCKIVNFSKIQSINQKIIKI